ncbi:MAG: putative nicotinamide phosphoribosyltransferase [Prokaryotic dsDNA virus sp.]|nr:MAG: putative nicotinamide phosphoribosyltransferase [Prokaryotic dsDNA virus sp.]
MNGMIQTDSYKLSHKGFMENGTTLIYSNMTPRSEKWLPIPEIEKEGVYVVYGLQHTLIDFFLTEMSVTFFNMPEDSAVGYLQGFYKDVYGMPYEKTEHFRELHRLGYLPLEVKALPEGMVVPIKVPTYTIQNTIPQFAWLTNFVETIMSCETWKAQTVATLIWYYRKLVNKCAVHTTGSTDGTEFQLHDFSFRGMSNRQDSAKSSSAFLLSSNGSDTVPANQFIANYYKSHWSNEFISTSVPASEHSLASTGIAVRGELEMLRKWITEDYPTGIVSVISDTFDFWKVLTEYVVELKQDILNRIPNELGIAKTVFRPDSGDPVKIVTGYTTSDKEFTEADLALYHYNNNVLKMPEAVKIDGQWFELNNFRGKAVLGKELAEHEVKGAIEVLWDIFGGTETEQGYRVLHERVGLIYGDSMNYERIQQICERLADKGFASTNVVFGVGSFTMQYMTRDTLGMAVKATYAEVNGQSHELFKDPATDDGTKKSAKGLLRVDYDENGNIALFDQQTREQEQQGLLKTVFKDGELFNTQSFQEIRERLWG